MLMAMWLPAACGKRTAPEPQTPEEMYARVRELLQPNVEHDASDYEQAMMWLRRAAEGGHLQAQTDLGGIYLEGGKGGVQANAKEALRWFSRAAEQGSKEAFYYMGLILNAGNGVPRDEKKALEYWQRAADAGVAEAQLRLAMLKARAADAETVQRGVQGLTHVVSRAGDAPAAAAQAACALGFLYASGAPGVERDMNEAARWYALAADGGDAAAQLVYAIMLLQGDPVPRDAERGMSYLRLAAGRDNPAAIRLLIRMLREGNGAAAQQQEAAAWEERLNKLEKHPQGL